MVIVAGHMTVEPQQRESHVTGWVSIAEQARRAGGCLDFAISADLLDPGAASTASSAGSRKRPARPSAAAAHEEQRAAMLTVAAQEYIADVRPVFGERTA